MKWLPSSLSKISCSEWDKTVAETAFSCKIKYNMFYIAIQMKVQLQNTSLAADVYLCQWLHYCVWRQIFLCISTPIYAQKYLGIQPLLQSPFQSMKSNNILNVSTVRVKVTLSTQSSGSDAWTFMHKEFFKR